MWDSGGPSGLYQPSVLSVWADTAATGKEGARLLLLQTFALLSLLVIMLVETSS